MVAVKTTRSAVQGGVAAEAHLSGKYKYNNCKDYKNSNHVFLIQGIVKTISNHLLICRRRWTSKGIFLQAASVCSQMGEVALLMHPCHQMGLWSNQVRWLFWDYWSRENDRTLGMTWGPTAYTETSSPPWVSSERGNVAICLKVFAWKFIQVVFAHTECMFHRSLKEPNNFGVENRRREEEGFVEQLLLCEFT